MTVNNQQHPLQGRHAVITGANGGIGEAIALELAGKGATLTLLGRDAKRLEAVLQKLTDTPSVTEHGYVLADITDIESVVQAMGQAVDARGAIDILINNAGAAKSAPFVKTQASDWNNMINVNLNGTFNCIHAVLPKMLDAKFGRIVNIASTAGLVGYAYVASYCAAKHGVIGLTRALALEVATQNVTINAVCPGYTDTPLLAGAIENIVTKTGRSTDEAKARLASSNPQGRLVKPEEVANAVAWLCSPGAEAIHGQSIAVAGGEVM